MLKSKRPRRHSCSEMQVVFYVYEVASLISQSESQEDSIGGNKNELKAEVSTNGSAVCSLVRIK